MNSGFFFIILSLQCLTKSSTSKMTRILFISSVLITLYFQRACADVRPEDEDTSDDEIFTSRFHPEKGIVNELYKWPNATAVYKFADNFNADEIARIKKSMAKVTDDGCVKLREKTDADVDYVEFVKELHPVASKWFPCAVHVGRKGGKQFLYFGNPDICIHDGYTAHLILHIFGMLHEIHRPDRDEHVRINMDNVREKACFTKFELAPTYGQPYDFGSIVHFDKQESSLDPSIPTITCVKQDVPCVLGQLVDLSPIDKKKLRVLYNCPLN